KKIVGYVLPLRRRWGSGLNWTSGPWFLRTEHLFLIPGDSPIGLRLPLDSIPWVSRIDNPSVYPRDPMEPLPLLPPREQLRTRPQGEKRVVQAFLRSDSGNVAR